MEKDMSMGEFLRHERECRSITIEQVASATKVGVRTLHLLEEDQYAELPAKPFIRGFVTSYCRFIGLDPKEVLGRFDDYISHKTNERPNRDSGHSGYVFEKKDGEQQGRTILMFAILGFVVLGGVAMLLLKPSLHHHRRSHIEKLRAVHTVGESPVPSPSSSSEVSQGVLSKPSPENSVAPAASTPSPASSGKVETAGPLVAKATPNPSDEPQTVAGSNPKDPLDSGAALSSTEVKHKIVSKIFADIWVRYQVDDRPIRKFIIRKGRNLVLRGKNQVWIQVSNPNSLNFKYNTGGSEFAGKLQNVVLVRGVTTLYYPNELSEKIDQILIHEKPLPSTPDPDSN